MSEMRLLSGVADATRRKDHPCPALKRRAKLIAPLRVEDQSEPNLGLEIINRLPYFESANTYDFVGAIKQFYPRPI